MCCFEMRLLGRKNLKKRLAKLRTFLKALWNPLEQSGKIWHPDTTIIRLPFQIGHIDKKDNCEKTASVQGANCNTEVFTDITGLNNIISTISSAPLKTRKTFLRKANKKACLEFVRRLLLKKKLQAFNLKENHYVQQNNSICR